MKVNYDNNINSINNNNNKNTHPHVDIFYIIQQPHTNFITYNNRNLDTSDMAEITVAAYNREMYQ